MRQWAHQFARRTNSQDEEFRHLREERIVDGEFSGFHNPLYGGLKNHEKRM